MDCVLTFVSLYIFSSFLSLYLQDNYNALHLAVLHSREDIVKLLLTKRADITTLAGVSLAE